MPLIGAAYLRCSDPRQDKSIDQQRAEITRRAAADGVVIPDENWFVDEGISGRSTRKRTSYQRLIRRAEDQKDRAYRGVPIQRLYVWAFSRIARNMFDCLRAIATLDDADIEITSLTEHEVGDRSMRKLIRPILAWLAERYSEELSRNVQRGMLSQASKGYWAYGAHSYGYDVEDAGGGKRLVVTERSRPEFEVVRRIFTLADEGRDGARRMAAQLTREGIAPPSTTRQERQVAPGAWLVRHVRDILKNPVYCGHIVNKGEIVARDAHEAAVDDATFARVQARRRARGEQRQQGRGNGADPLKTAERGLFTPFLRCGSCGGRVTLIAGGRTQERTWLYFCGTRRQNQAACPGISVRVDVLDPLLLDAIEREVLAPEPLQALIDATRASLADASQDGVAARRAELEREVVELDRKIRGAGTQVMNGLIEEDDARAITAPLRARRDHARLELAGLPSGARAPTAIDADSFRAAVSEAWRARPVLERREALARLVDRVTLTPGGAHITYSASRYCGDDRSSCVIQPSFPWMRLNRSPSIDRRAK